MSNEGYVTDKEFSIVTENINKQQERDETRLNDHSKSLDELANISAKLTLLVEQQGKTIDEHAKRILELEKSKPWYDTEIGRYIIKSGIGLVFILVAAAVGLNALDTLKAAQGIKP